MKRKSKKQRVEEKRQLIRNKKLCKRYPFLIPYNRWTGKIGWEKRKLRRLTGSWYSYPYSYTELDAMPRGWRKAFGKELLEELREDLIKCHYLNEFRVMQIKEKYGGLRFYVGAIPIESKAYDIIDKYEIMSYNYCMVCGAPAETINIGSWIATMCEKCKNHLF